MRFSLFLLMVVPFLRAAEKPRVFITETRSLEVSGDASAGDAKGAVAISRGTSPQNLEVIKAFAELCPGVSITNDQSRADFVLEFDHEPNGPTTPFTHGNKMAIYTRDHDLAWADHTRLLKSGVKKACGVMTGSKR